MKKLLSILFLIPALCFGQMNPSVGVYNGLCYKLWDNPGTSNLVVVLQGSGEFTQTTDCSDFYKFIDKNSYASKASVYTYPFDILIAASYKAPGQTGYPSQVAIKSNLSSLVRSLQPNKVVLTGYSFGGQCAAGFLTNSQNGYYMTKYLESDIYDGYVIMCGKTPGNPSWCANDKPVMMVHGTSDNQVSYNNSVVLMYNLSACPDRISPEYLVTITGGSHASAWTCGYNKDNVYGAKVYDFIMSVFR